MLSSLRKFSKEEVAQERLKIINFYQRYGEKATLEAFGVDRKLIYIWRKRLKTSGNQLFSLIPSSTKPKNTRRSPVDPKVVEYIKNLREEHPRLGKEKIKILLDEYCLKEDLPPISESTIGRVIKRNKFFFQKQGRIYHTPGSGWAKRKKRKRLRVRYAPKPKEFGHLQLDTILKLVDGVKLYVYSGTDIKLKFSLSLPYPRLNSKNTLGFFKKLELVYPGKIKSIQTDNGLEFLGVFDQYLAKKNIPHFFIYPRCPRINGVVERYQRTFQEEFLNHHLHLIHQPQSFSSKLAQYLIFYNTKRPHQSLGLMSPMDYLIKKGGMSKKYWTSTCPCQKPIFMI